jgi:hypothetical protein
MIVDDTSTDVDQLREELKFELIVLHGEVKELNKNWDFTKIVDPLLADQGPAIQVIPKIKKQIERLQQLKDGFEQKARDLQRPAAALAVAAQSLYGHCTAELPDTKEGQPTKQYKPLRRRQLPLPKIVIDEVLPSWGECKRYSRPMDQKHYNSLVAIARNIYNIILQSPNPQKCAQCELQGDLLHAICNRWLAFQKHQGCGNKPKFLLGSDRV